MTHAPLTSPVSLRTLNRNSAIVRVWQVRLDAASLSPRGMEQLLSSDEKERARRYVFERDRRRFTAARGSLRQILSRYLDQDPEAITFAYGSEGKPRLADDASDLRFNVSHSGEIALIAVTHGRELGIDVECLRPLTDLEGLLATNFSACEIEAFRALPKENAQMSFFAGWTRKEAYLKAKGCGLAIPLNGFSVTMDPMQPAALLDVENSPSEASRWRMIDLAVPEGYAGTLVAENGCWQCDFANWNT